MDTETLDLSKLDSDKTVVSIFSDDRGEYSQISETTNKQNKRRKLLSDLEKAEDERRDLNYNLFNLAVITEQDTRKIKSCYDKIVHVLRSSISHPCMEDKKELFKNKLITYCEEFITIVDERISPHYWVAVNVKGNLLRLKADYLRYLFEIYPNNGTYQIRAHSAYTETKSFFINNHLTKTSEWYRLRLNYASLLYLDGFPTAAMFICQQLIKSSKIKPIDSVIEKRIRRNIEFFKQASLN